MTVIDIYNEFRDKFSEVTVKADEVHILEWDEVDSDLAYAWFESLAKALNLEMARGSPVDIYIPVFKFMHNKYLSGDI
ncbi:hypothetical protein [Microbulbifer taiwanensis]|uniref:Acyl carrier protein n=1 Tax=Microbulbifer taiwanensis TaxID=986746 RepID=A0ABW1YVQ0_9GAMM|nr:hypothetical protein [Microbulbifer taiwanensis]